MNDVGVHIENKKSHYWLCCLFVVYTLRKNIADINEAGYLPHFCDYMVSVLHNYHFSENNSSGIQ